MTAESETKLRIPYLRELIATPEISLNTNGSLKRAMNTFAVPWSTQEINK